MRNAETTLRVGDQSPSWKGGRSIRADGYVQVWAGPRSQAGHPLEHRLVVETALGRKLEAHELVHHINGDPSDNRLENLHVCDSAKAHCGFHSKNGKGG